MLNKKGYVLIYAIGVIALLILLAASLTEITSTRTLWVTKQAYNIKEMNEAKARVEAASSELADYFKNDFNNSKYRYLNELLNDPSDTSLSNTMNAILDKYDVGYRDLTQKSCEYPNVAAKAPCYHVADTTYTYAFDIVYPKTEDLIKPGDFVVQKRFFLSMIPSFLYFALGSKSNMTIDGGAYIDGDIYINNDLYLANEANYIYNSDLRKEESTFLTMQNTNNIYLQDKLYTCYANTSCYSIESSETTNQFVRTNSFQEANDPNFYPSSLTGVNVKKYSNQFLNVDFDASYNYYLNEAIRLPSETVENNQKFDVNHLSFSDYASLFSGFETEGRIKQSSFTDIQNIQDVNTIDKSYYINGDPNDNYNITLNSGLNFPKDKWIIVNGNLTINILAFGSNLINANLLVTGNITISGNVQLNSTIYALGDALIHEAYINKDTSTDNQLMLLSKGTLQISKINPGLNTFEAFKTNTSNSLEVDPDIRGFFYTDKTVKLYTVDSYIAIKGGIFANDSNYTAYINSISDSDPNNDLPPSYIENHKAFGLVINSYRGKVEDNGSGFTFSPPINSYESRLVIEHDNYIINSQRKGLPLNEKINYITEDITVK